MNKILSLYKKHKEIINYLIVGGLTTIISMALFYGSTWTFLDGNNPIQLQIANVLSWTGAVIFSYFANRIFVFESKEKNILKEFLAFVSSRVLTLLLDMGTMFILSTLLSCSSSKAANFSFAIAILSIYITTFCFSLQGKRIYGNRPVPSFP